MTTSEKSTTKSIARTSLAFYIRDELRAAMRARRRSRFGWWLACRSGRGAGLAGSTRELVRVLLHRGETTWQQRRRRPLAKEARRPAAHRRARALGHARGTRQHARPRVVSAGSSLQAKQLKSRRIRRLFCLWSIISNNARSPIQRFARSTPGTPARPSGPSARTRCSARGSSSDSPRSRKPLPRP